VKLLSQRGFDKRQGRFELTPSLLRTTIAAENIIKPFCTRLQFYYRNNYSILGLSITHSLRIFELQ